MDRTAEILAAMGSDESLDIVQALLARQTGTSIRELVSASGINQPKVTRIIQALDHAGLIVRAQGEHPISIALAEQVRALLDQATTVASATLRDQTEKTEQRQRNVRRSRLADASAGRRSKG
jgi:DNA-binding MarR family transcriptional regulator